MKIQSHCPKQGTKYYTMTEADTQSLDARLELLDKAAELSTELCGDACVTRTRHFAKLLKERQVNNQTTLYADEIELLISTLFELTPALIQEKTDNLKEQNSLLEQQKNLLLALRSEKEVNRALMERLDQYEPGSLLS